MKIPTLSIITVCFRAKTQLQATMKNILSQTWTDFEYLVIDGGSDDGTKEFLVESMPLFTAKKVPFRFLSEPDKGIYDAMNKGTRLAKGRWLLFLNAGDFFADNHTLEQIFTDIPNAQIIYGDTLCSYQEHQKLYPALPLEYLTREMAFCHQSVFVRRELLLEHPYNTTYKVCADHEFFLSMYLQHKAFTYRRIPVSIYEISGYSDKNQMIAHKEQHRMQKEAGVFRFSLGWLWREGVFYMKQGMKKVLGQGGVDRIRKRLLR